MSKQVKGVLLVNLGTPDSPSVPDVRKYLREFLMDKRVIDIPSVPRWLLVNLIIAPFRAPKSAKTYQELWEERGSPLMFHGVDVKDKLQKLVPEEYVVELAMRYQSPSIQHGLDKLMKHNPSELIIVPLFPQYASATTGSVHDMVMEKVKEWQIIPKISFVSQFFDHPKLIQAFAERGRQYLDKQEYDHIVFSYHGLPERQIRKGSVDNYCKLSDCCNSLHSKNRFCYRAQCFATSRLIAKELDLQEKDYTVCFQSRLGKDPWIQPYAEDVIELLASEGKKRVLVFSPAFVADCLETTIEVGEEFKEEFIEKGGEQWDLVEGLNSSDTFVHLLHDLVVSDT